MNEVDCLPFPRARQPGAMRGAGTAVPATATAPAPPIPAAALLARGVSRLLIDHGYRVLREFRLANGRRADVIGLDRRGWFTIVEVKSSPADYRADDKWPGYRAYCDRFYFAVGVGFPVPILPADAGVIAADGYGGAILRDAPAHLLAPARRKALLLRFARTACARLEHVADAPAVAPAAPGCAALGQP